MAESSSVLNQIKMRFLRGISTGVYVLIGTLVFGFVAFLCVAVQHMDQGDPRAIMIEKVIGNGGLFLGIIFLVIRQELASVVTQRTEKKLEVNTQKTVEAKEQIERVAEQTNGNLDKRMRAIIAENDGKYATKEEMSKMVKEAAQIAAQRQLRRRRKR